MQRFKSAVFAIITLTLCACGNGSSKGHGDRGESATPIDEPLVAQEFGDVVMRMVAEQDDTNEPEEIQPDTWSYHINENEAAFDHLF